MDTDKSLESLSPGDTPKSPLSVERPLAPSPRQCSSLTRAGSRCKGYALHHRDTCQSHSPEGLESRAKAVVASAEARSGKVEKRKEAIEAAKLSLTEALAVAAADRQADIVQALVTRAVDGDMRAQSILWERTEGKVADRLITEAGDPFEMTEAQLAKWLDAPTEDGTVSNPAPTTDEQGSGHTQGQD